MKRVRLAVRYSLYFAVLAALFASVSSQIPRFQDYLDHALGGFPELAQVIDSPTLTTSLDDAVFGLPFLDDYEPLSMMALADAPRSSSGGFLLHEGVFEGEVHSYCLKPGTYGPGDGNGYLYGPVSGPYADIVETILRNSVLHPDISHGDIQMLLWAALTRAGIKKTPPHLQWVAAQLLSPEQVFRLNGGALALVPEDSLNKALGNFPGVIRKVLKTEARMRSMLTASNPDYESLERIAILAGAPPFLPGDRRVPRTRWSVNPAGYLVRYLPKAASRTRIQVWVPRHVRGTLDSLGRIETVEDNHGNQLRFDYIDSAVSIMDPGLRNAKLRRIRWDRLNQGIWTTEELAFRSDSGWTWYRKSPTSTRHNTVDSQRTSDNQNPQYVSAREREAEVEALLSLASQNGIRSPLFLQFVLNAVHLRETLGAELSGGNSAVRTAVDLLSQGIAGELGDLSRSSAILPVEVDPASQIAVPANTGRQRLGLSARLY